MGVSKEKAGTDRRFRCLLKNQRVFLVEMENQSPCVAETKTGRFLIVAPPGTGRATALSLFRQLVGIGSGEPEQDRR